MFLNIQTAEMAEGGGSATGNPRNKVALAPGHSLMDWIRLGNSGVDLTGTGGRLLDVTRDELGQHNTQSNAWISIRGKVYNITRYIHFHPGGVDELMKGAGIDATSLFDQVHPWVNYESLLQKCLVGRLVNSVDDNAFAAPPPPPPQSTPKKPGKQNFPKCVAKFEWYQKMRDVVLVFHLKDMVRQFHMNMKTDGELWSYIDGEWVGWTLPTKVDWPPVLTVTSHKSEFTIEIKFPKDATNPWGRLPYIEPGNKPVPPSRFQLKVNCVRPISHNVFLIGLTYLNLNYNYVPLGYHLTLHSIIEGVQVERQYTPVSNLMYNFPHDVTLMVKRYDEGLFSSWLTSLKENDVVVSSMPIGSFNPALLRKATHVVLLAAGTGFTPMARLIQWALQPKKKISVKLLFFNRMEKDIIWKEELESLTHIDTRFAVEHILSQADASWSGKRGWITLQLLESELPDFSKVVPLPYFVCVCGPTAFTQLAERYLQDMNYTAEHYFCFKG